MTEEFQDLRGFSELAAFMETLPPKIERNVARGSLRAAATVVGREAKGHIPVGEPSSEGKRAGGYAGALRDSVRVSTGTTNGTAMARLVVGGKRKGVDAFYAHMVEFGTQAHTITAKDKRALSVGGLFFQSVEHPGARPHAFMRPAFDARAQDAILAAGEYVKNRLATKEGLDTVDVDIGIETSP